MNLNAEYLEWAHAPDWANWRSVDKDGIVSYWKNKPIADSKRFISCYTDEIYMSVGVASLNKYQISEWPNGMLVERPNEFEIIETTNEVITTNGIKSDGSTASYYELPANAKELQDLISHRNMNAQDGEIFRAIYRKGLASHSDELRDAKKVLFYAKAEVERLEKLSK